MKKIMILFVLCLLISITVADKTVDYYEDCENEVHGKLNKCAKIKENGYNKFELELLNDVLLGLDGKPIFDSFGGLDGNNNIRVVLNITANKNFNLKGFIKGIIKSSKYGTVEFVTESIYKTYDVDGGNYTYFVKLDNDDYKFKAGDSKIIGLEFHRKNHRDRVDLIPEIDSLLINEWAWWNETSSQTDVIAGTNTCTGTWQSACSFTYDGDWGTAGYTVYTPSPSSTTVTKQYTIPSGATEATTEIRVKHSSDGSIPIDETFNISDFAGCYNQTDYGAGKIVLQQKSTGYQSSPFLQIAYLYCYKDSSFTLISTHQRTWAQNGVDGRRLFETSITYSVAEEFNNTATTIPSGNVSAALDIGGYCNASSTNQTFNISYYYGWYKNDILNYSGFKNNSGNGYEQGVNYLINTLSSTLTDPGQNWSFACTPNNATDGTGINSSTAYSSNVSIIEPEPNVTIIFPINATTYTNATLPYNFTVEGIYSSYDCWRSLDGEANVSLGSVSNGTTFTGSLANMSAAVHTLLITCEGFALNGTDSIGFTTQLSVVDSVDYDTPVTELTTQYYLVVINVSEIVSDVEATLNWNGTDIAYTTKSNTSTQYTFNASNIMPSVESETNYSFYWNYTLTFINTSTDEINTSTYNQTVISEYYISNFTLSDTTVLEGDSVTGTVTVTIPIGSSALVYVDIEVDSVNYTATSAVSGIYTASFNAPSPTSINETLNATAWLNVDTGSGNKTTSDNEEYTTFRMILSTDCVSYPTPTLNFTYKDEETDATINATMNGTFDVSNGGANRNYSFSFSSAANHTICKYPADMDFDTDSIQQYDSSGYTFRNYYLSGATLTNSTNGIVLYLLNTSSGKTTIVNVKDANSQNLEGALVIIQRYDLGSGNYTTVSTLTTDNQGNTQGFLASTTVYYRFTVVTSTTTQAFEPQIISCDVADTTCYVYLELGTGIIGNYIEYITGVYGDCVFDNSTNNLICSATDTSGLYSNFDLRVYQHTGEYFEEICHETDTGSTVSLICNLGSNVTGELFNYQFSVQDADGTYILLSDNPALDFSDFFDFGLFGTILAFLIMGTLALIGMAFGPAGPPIMVVVGLSISWFLGLIKVSWLYVGGIGLVAVILLYKTRK